MDLENLTFYSLPLLSRKVWTKDVFEVFFPRPFPFSCGQLCAIHRGNVAQARLYSIASGTDQDCLSFLYKEVAGGYLTPALSTVSRGTVFFISAPFGQFLLQNASAVWIATGTGIAPFLSAVQSFLCVSNKLLIQGARTPPEFLAQKLFEASAVEYVRCSSAGIPATGLYAGRLTSFLRKTPLDLTHRKIYLCGSSPMVVEVRQILVEGGVDLEDIICEVYF